MAATATLLAALATALVPVGGASAQDYETRFLATVDQVLVNRYGGITVSGTLDCSEQVAAANGGEEYVPNDTMVLVNANWTARQYVGRNKVVEATYLSGIAGPCYLKDSEGVVHAPLSWKTQYAYPVGDTQWVYSPSGKFGSGAIHIELEVGNVGYPFAVGDDSYTLVSLNGWDLRATWVR
jgi:hypothetical protein